MTNGIRTIPARQRDSGRPWTGRGCRVATGWIDEVCDVVARTRGLLDLDATADGPITDHASARAALAAVWDAAVAGSLRASRTPSRAPR